MLQYTFMSELRRNDSR